MGWSINNDTNWLGTIRFMSQSYQLVTSSMARLASGLRINSAAEDPAGLVISEQLRGQIASLNQEVENTSALIHKYQTAGAYAMELRSKLTELRELAVGAANKGFNSPSIQAAYDNTAGYIVERFNAEIVGAEYNGVSLFDGSDQALGEISELQGVDLSTAEAAEASISVIDEAVNELDELQVDLGATQANELESHRRTLQVTAQNLTAAESQLRDTDFAREYSAMVGNQIRMQASLALLSHSFASDHAILKILGS